MKKSKKIPKSHLPKFGVGGGTTDDNATEGTQNIYNDKRSSKLNIGQYANYATAAVNLGVGLSNNQKLSGAAKNQANANTINSTVDAVAGSALPWYGYAKTASGIGKSLTSPTSVTDPTTGKTVTQSSNRTNQAFSDTFTPTHETTINKASEGDWGGAALNIITSGVWNTMDNYLNGTNQKEFDKAKANEATYNQQQTDLANQQNAAAQQQQNDYINSAIQSGLANQQPQNSYIQYAMGGMKFGMGGANAEIEKQENVVAPEGGFLQANGPSHEQGGVPVSLPGNSMIFSDRLKLGKKTFADLNKVNNTNKEDKVLESNKYGTTSKRTAELMKFAKNKNSEELFNAQEALKKAKVEAYAKRMGVKLPSTDNESMEQGQSEASEGEYRMGGKLPMYPLGGGVDNTKFTPNQRQQAYTDSMTLYNSGLGNQANFKVQGSNDALHSLHLLNKTFPQPVSTRTVNTPAGSEIVSQYQKPVYNPSMVKKAKPIINNSNPEKFQKMEMRGLDYTPEPNINPQIQQVPANAPYTGSTQIITGPNFSQKLYKDSTGKELDKSYFDPSRKNVEIEPFRNGGRMLPKYLGGGYFNEATGEWVENTGNPDFSSENTNNNATYSKALDLKGYNQFPNNSQPQRVTDPNDKNFDWGSLAQTGQSLGNFAMQNAGNIYDLTRKQDPLQKYDRAKASFLDPSSAIRDALAQTRRAEYNIRNASGGNAGTYLANRVGLNAQNTENLARIHQNYANANANIANQNSQFNTEIAYREAEAQAKDRAMRQNVDSQAIHSMASNFGKMSKSSKQDNMEQKELDMFMYRYKNEPGFKEQVDKFRTT